MAFKTNNYLNAVKYAWFWIPPLQLVYFFWILNMLLWFIYYNFLHNKMVRGIVNNFKCSLIIFFSPFSICASTVSFFLASLCPFIHGTAFEKMFTSHCLCAIIRQCRINLSLYKWTPLLFFVLLNRNCRHLSQRPLQIVQRAF